MTIEAITVSLTEAQKRAVTLCVTSRGIAQTLLRKGLVRTTQAHDGIGVVLTLSAAGAAVRDHLRAQGPVS